MTDTLEQRILEVLDKVYFRWIADETLPEYLAPRIARAWKAGMDAREAVLYSAVTGEIYDGPNPEDAFIADLSEK